MKLYNGPLSREIAADLDRCGSPITADDLSAHIAQERQPLTIRIGDVQLYNFPPPTQGLASLMILALFDRLKVKEAESFDYLHGLVEATKRAFIVRDRIIGDLATMADDPTLYLEPSKLDELTASIDRAHALPWPHLAQPGDTIWLGAIDRNGLAVSFIQSTYFEFGSGCVLENTGFVWQNRGSSFTLGGAPLRTIGPGRKPFHTLNPALALFDDGRRLVYGTMGGEGQPQTQSAIFTRYAWYGQGLQAAVTAPRWLLGRTWGSEKVEMPSRPSRISVFASAGNFISSPSAGSLPSIRKVEMKFGESLSSENFVFVSSCWLALTAKPFSANQTASSTSLDKANLPPRDSLTSEPFPSPIMCLQRCSPREARARESFHVPKSDRNRRTLHARHRRMHQWQRQVCLRRKSTKSHPRRLSSCG